MFRDWSFRVARGMQFIKRNILKWLILILIWFLITWLTVIWCCLKEKTPFPLNRSRYLLQDYMGIPIVSLNLNTSLFLVCHSWGCWGGLWASILKVALCKVGRLPWWAAGPFLWGRVACRLLGTGLHGLVCSGGRWSPVGQRVCFCTVTGPLRALTPWVWGFNQGGHMVAPWANDLSSCMLCRGSRILRRSGLLTVAGIVVALLLLSKLWHTHTHWERDFIVDIVCLVSAVIVIIVFLFICFGFFYLIPPYTPDFCCWSITTPILPCSVLS